MKKILCFLMVGLAFTALQVGTAEAVKDCSDFTPGTPPFQSCVDANAKAALNNNEGNQSGGDAGALQNNAGTTPTGAPGAAPMGTPGTAPMGVTGGPPMGDTANAPKVGLGQRIKNLFGMGAKDVAPPTGAPGMPATTGAPNMAPPTGAPGMPATTGAPGTAPTGAPGTAPMGALGTAPTGAPGTAPMGDPSCAPLANGTLPPHCK